MPTLPALLLALLMLWAPWPFGSVAPWAAPLAGAGLVIFVVSLLRSRAVSAGLPAEGARVALALAGLGAWGWVQSWPWPAALTRWVSPHHATVAAEAARGAAASLGERGADPTAVFTGAAPWTLAVPTTRATAWLCLALAAVLLAACRAGRQRLDRRLLAVALVGGALAQAAFGVPRWLARATTLWGLDLPGEAGRLRGTFVNANHLALLLELALVVVFAWGWWVARRQADEPSAERRVLAFAPPLGLWLLLLIALVLTGSRAGLVAGVAGTTFQGWLLARRYRRKGLALGLVVAVVVGGLLVVTLLARGTALRRFDATALQEATLSARLVVNQAGLELWARYPFTGAGLGAFRDAFPAVQPGGLARAWVHAHNDVLELAITAGVPGVALLAWALWCLVRRLRKVLRTGRRSEDRAAALAASGALVAVGCHELLDFGLTLPANALVFVVVLGAALGARTQDEGPSGADQGRQVSPAG